MNEDFKALIKEFNLSQAHPHKVERLYMVTESWYKDRCDEPLPRIAVYREIMNQLVPLIRI